ncbi:MAG TPA: tRNA (N6-threonylcarbamoyladenosine(37)-N6)-methyltransferase TrmO [Clostridiales bacterium]|nr:tRNA (N6-threonylcarbamoyladenosine(37)-N6)-methyltransferase TrmO [Clostridiales bacterium]
MPNSNSRSLKYIGRIHTDFPSKFGIPRQSGIVKSLKGTIVFEPEFRNSDAIRGLEGFSHIWIIWEFSQAVRETWSPMVKPPRLGGNTRMGVFATRSPYRPNPIGLSSVKLDRVEIHPDLGPLIHVSAADIMDNTPIYDIKPYLTYTDCHSDAVGGYVDDLGGFELEVIIPDKWIKFIPYDKREALIDTLSHDPRPSYQNDSNRIYGLYFSGFDVRFRVKDEILTVCEIVEV